MKFKLSILIIFCFLHITCTKDTPEKKEPTPIPEEKDPKITSAEYHDKLLFVNNNDFKIKTSEPATFSSDDPNDKVHITISSDGIVKRISSGEVVTITVNWTNSGTKSKLYAVGATDDDHIHPFVKFQGADSDDPYAQYIQGWKTLQKLPVTGETYYIVLRHADADNGKDFNRTTNIGPADWWKSCDNTLARQINQQGIDRARELGKIFKDLDYPIGRVISSEFCRAVKTAELINAELINAGPEIEIDGRVNHPAYLVSGKRTFLGLKDIIQEKSTDNKITLISTHHPINEFNNSGIPTFPKVSAFNWTGAYFIKVSADKTITYEGAASWGMFKYCRNLRKK